MKRGTVFIVSAPSGVGKTTLLNELIQQDTEQRLALSISHTTRKPREEEINGLDYYFVNIEEFKALEKQGAMLESAEVFGHCYGTARQWIEHRLVQGKDVILEIDVQGALQVMQRVEDTCSIFIFPPSMPVLHSRLAKRDTDSQQVIKRRLQGAKNEIKEAHNFQYWLVNKDFSEALKSLQDIFKKPKSFRPEHPQIAEEFLELIASSKLQR